MTLSFWNLVWVLQFRKYEKNLGATFLKKHLFPLYKDLSGHCLSVCLSVSIIEIYPQINNISHEEYCHDDIWQLMTVMMEDDWFLTQSIIINCNFCKFKALLAWFSWAQYISFWPTKTMISFFSRAEAPKSLRFIF